MGPTSVRVSTQEFTVGAVNCVLFATSPALMIGRFLNASCIRNIEPHPLKQIEILVSVRLEIETEVKQRFDQDVLRTEEKGDEQPPQSAVAIEKGVDRFKLHVGEGTKMALPGRLPPIQFWLYERDTYARTRSPPATVSA
jgi:hypothetical protein